MKTQPLNIFLVAKDHMIVEHYRQCLETMGFNNVTPFDSAICCIQSLDKKPDVILVSATTDPAFGLEFLKSVKAVDDKIEVILLPGITKPNRTDVAAKADNVFNYLVSVLDRITVVRRFFNQEKFVY